MASRPLPRGERGKLSARVATCLWNADLMRTLTVDAVVESWPIAGEFVIARGAKREATVVVAQVGDGTATGRGECVPYARYGETVAGARDAILAMRGAIRDRTSLQQQLPAGAPPQP